MDILLLLVGLGLILGGANFLTDGSAAAVSYTHLTLPTT